MVLAIGATVARDLPITGRELGGIHQAMEFLPQSNRASLGEAGRRTRSCATGKHVVIIGGGDTGADCLGTSHRQHAASVTQLEIMPQPGEDRPSGQPWPTYPMLFRVSSAHEEGGERVYSVSTQEFLGDDDGNVRALRLVDVEMKDGRFSEVEGTEREIPAELVLFAMGFTGPEQDGVVAQLDVDLDQRGNDRARRRLHVHRAGRLRRRRRGPRPVADRVGDRRGPGRRRGGRHLPHRVDDAAVADPADRASAGRVSPVAGSHLGTIQRPLAVTHR